MHYMTNTGVCVPETVCGSQQGVIDCFLMNSITSHVHEHFFPLPLSWTKVVSVRSVPLCTVQNAAKCSISITHRFTFLHGPLGGICKSNHTSDVPRRMKRKMSQSMKPTSKWDKSLTIPIGVFVHILISSPVKDLHDSSQNFCPI